MWAQVSKCYDQLRVVNDMNDFKSQDEIFRCYEQLKVLDNINDSRSRKLRALDARNNSGL